MKKVALSLIALLAVGTFAFAEDVAVEKAAAVAVTLSADAKVKFGVDLDTKQTGFSHGENFDLTVTLVPEAASNKAGTGDVYATIEVADVSVEIDEQDGTADDDSTWLAVGDITAKIVFPNGYFKFNENVDPKIGYQQDLDDDNGGSSIVGDGSFYTYSAKYGGTETEWAVGDTPDYSAWAGQGVEFNYTIPEVVGLTFAVASQGSWAQTHDGYEGTAEAAILALPELTLKVKGYYGNAYVGTDAKGYTGAGAAFAYAIPDLMTPFADVNYRLSSGADNTAEWNADSGVRFGIDGLKLVVAAASYSSNKTDVYVTADLAQAKLAGPVGAMVGLKLIDVLTDVKANKKTEVFYKVMFDLGGGIGLWTKGSYNNSAVADSDSLFLKAGLDAAVFPLTTIGAEYDSSDFGAAKAQGDNKLGQLYGYVKVAY